MAGNTKRPPIWVKPAHEELELAPAVPQFELGTVKGEIRGTAVIRDKDGNVKGEFSFGGPTTLTADEVKEELGLNQEKQEEVVPNGGDSNDDGS